tara:strand:+ start:825 stop:1046 length:222 start_codon:yes stop_codon:yes gene_type:complete
MNAEILQAFWNYEDEEISMDGQGDMSTHYYEFWNEVFHHLDPKAFNAALKRAAKSRPEGNAAEFLKSEQYRRR